MILTKENKSQLIEMYHDLFNLGVTKDTFIQMYQRDPEEGQAAIDRVVFDIESLVHQCDEDHMYMLDPLILLAQEAGFTIDAPKQC